MVDNRSVQAQIVGDEHGHRIDVRRSGSRRTDARGAAGRAAHRRRRPVRPDGRLFASYVRDTAQSSRSCLPDAPAGADRVACVRRAAAAARRPPRVAGRRADRPRLHSIRSAGGWRSPERLRVDRRRRAAGRRSSPRNSCRALSRRVDFRPDHRARRAGHQPVHRPRLFGPGDHDRRKASWPC